MGTYRHLYPLLTPLPSFHSIGIPSEWGPNATWFSELGGQGFHSIGIPSEWGPRRAYEQSYATSRAFPFNWDPQRVGTRIRRIHNPSQPGPFPFNWDPQRVGTFHHYVEGENVEGVSIQLGSPASGDRSALALPLAGIPSFHSIGIPSEWGRGGRYALGR